MFWVHLYADESTRRARLQNRDGEVDERRLTSGDSLGVCREADINIDVADICISDVVTKIMSAHVRFGEYRNGHPDHFLSRIEMLKATIPMSQDSQNVQVGFTPIVANNVDDLVLMGLKHILQHGEHIDVSAGHGWQAYSVQYILTNPLNRLHTLRFPKSLAYFKAELSAYFLGSQNINDGLVKASSFWRSICTSHSRVNSNYGYYVFHETVPGVDSTGVSQYEWCFQLLKENLQSRKALINVNNSGHKIRTRDFPCTISIQFYTTPHSDRKVRVLHLDVKSRSTDIITGLPYDMGFFALLLEMMSKHLTQDTGKIVHMGNVSMSPTFTQLYESGLSNAESLLSKDDSESIESAGKMPEVGSVKDLLHDIYHREVTTDLMKWIQEG